MRRVVLRYNNIRAGLLNVKIILPKDKEDSILLLGGKKENCNKDFFNQFATELKLNEKQMSVVYDRVAKSMPQAMELIKKSFLSDQNKTAYSKLLNERAVIFTKQKIHPFSTKYTKKLCLVSEKW